MLNQPQQCVLLSTLPSPANLCPLSLFTFGRCSRSGPCAAGSRCRRRCRRCTGCSSRSARRSRCLGVEGRVGGRAEKKGGTNWFSMAIFGINYPTWDNLCMGSGGQERPRHALNLLTFILNLAICTRAANKNQTLVGYLHMLPCARGRNRHPGPTCSKHASDVSVALVEPLLHDGVDKGGAVEESPLVRLTVVLLRHLPPAAKRQSHI